MKLIAVVFIAIVCCFGVSVRCDTRPLSPLQNDRVRRSTIDTCPPLEPSMDSLTQEEFMAKLTDRCRYDHLSRPTSDTPLRVDFQIDLRHMESVDHTQFKTHIIVQTHFKDERLSFKDISPNRGSILGQETIKNEIWLPHTVIKNAKESHLMGLDGKDVFIKISPTGDITYSYRMTTTFYCQMDLRKFPFDHQLCEIIWTSWAYNESNLQLEWVKYNPFIISESLRLTEFSMDEVWVDYSTTPLSDDSMGWDEGYSSLVFKFRLKREVGYYILEYFLPSVLLVIMSWVSFWIQADAAPARTTLGTATMLSFITLNGNLSSQLPKVSYVKASEIWFFGGAAFIFCSLAEFAFVNVIWRRKKKVELAKPSSKYIIKGALSPRLARKDLRKSESFSSLDSKHSQTQNYLTVHGSSNSLNIPTINPPTNGDNTNQDTSPPTPTPSQQAFAEMTPQEVAIWIDRKARIAFPVMFFVYNVLYWSFVYGL